MVKKARELFRQSGTKKIKILPYAEQLSFFGLQILGMAYFKTICEQIQLKKHFTQQVFFSKKYFQKKPFRQSGTEKIKILNSKQLLVLSPIQTPKIDFCKAIWEQILGEKYC